MVAFTFYHTKTPLVLALFTSGVAFIRLYAYIAFRPHTVQAVNSVWAGTAATCLWISLCVIVAEMMSRQVVDACRVTAGGHYRRGRHLRVGNREAPAEVGAFRQYSGGSAVFCAL